MSDNRQEILEPQAEGFEMEQPLELFQAEQETEPHEKHRRAFQQATEMYSQLPDWVTFFREILGPRGVVRKLCQTPEALAEFEKTEEYAEIQLMLANLRKESRPAPTEPTKVITVRLPMAVHDALRNEAHDYHTSMNQLCISKLLQMVDGELVPPEVKSVPRPRAAAAQSAQDVAEPASTREGDTAAPEDAL